MFPTAPNSPLSTQPPVRDRDPAQPYLVDEKDLGSHIDAHSRHSPDSGVHTCQGVRATCQWRRTDVRILGHPLWGGGRCARSQVAVISASEHSEIGYPRVKPGNSPSDLIQPLDTGCVRTAHPFRPQPVHAPCSCASRPRPWGQLREALPHVPRVGSTKQEEGSSPQGVGCWGVRSLRQCG